MTEPELRAELERRLELARLANSDAEAEACREALRGSIRLVRQLRGLTHFAGTAESR